MAEQLISRDPILSVPPQKQVLLLTCMDLRFIDDVTHFMNERNLENRYDQLIFAGAAMGVMQVEAEVGKQKLPWKSVFFQHLKAAINSLRREIKDIIIMEHLDCGAYKYLHPDEDIQRDYKKFAQARKLNKLVDFHREEAKSLAKEIDDFCKEQQREASQEMKAKPKSKPKQPSIDGPLQGEAKLEAWKNIRVHRLLMGLTGKVDKL